MRLFTSLIIFPVFFSTFIKSQSVTSFGVGLNSSWSFYQRAGGPGFPVSPNLSFRINRAEIYGGADFYFTNNYANILAGAQAGFRFHFGKVKQKNNLFVDVNSAFIQFQRDCNNNRVNFYSGNWCTSGNIYKIRSYNNTIGIGYELNFLKRFYFCSVVGGGINYIQEKVFNDNTESGAKDVSVISPLAYLKLGFSYSFIQHTKNACDDCPFKK